jgi:hypothetical protein
MLKDNYFGNPYYALQKQKYTFKPIINEHYQSIEKRDMEVHEANNLRLRNQINILQIDDTSRSF